MDNHSTRDRIHTRHLRLRCPECHTMALRCEVITQGEEAYYVTLLQQACVCDVYADFDDVWEQAREIVREGQKGYAT